MQINRRLYFSLILLLAAAAGLAVLLVDAHSPDALYRQAQLSVSPSTHHSETWIVVADNEYSPYSFFDKDGQPSGHDVELAHLLGNQMGVNIDMRLMTWLEAKRLVLEGKAQMLMGIAFSPANLKNYAISLPIQNDYFQAFGLKNLDGMPQLYDKKLAALQDNGNLSVFLRNYELDKNTTFYNTYSDAFHAVIKGECDYVLARHAMGRKFVAQSGVSNFSAVGTPLSYVSFGFAVQKNDEARLERLNQAIRDLTRNGTLEALSAKWLKRYAEPPRFFDLVQSNAFKLIAVIASICSLGLLVYMHLYKRFTSNILVQRDNLARMVEQQQLLAEATRGMFENIFEWDITTQKAANDVTRQFFMGLGLPPDTSYDDGIAAFAETNIHQDYRQGYLDTFSSDKVILAVDHGLQSLQYDCRLKGGGKFAWLRVTARIFRSNADDSIRMLTFRQHIDNEKERELALLDKSLRDPMTGLYNKPAVEEIITRILRDPLPKDRCHAFFMLDIDRFKQVNDSLGHAFGDVAILNFVDMLRKQFRGTDVIGRVGGDEFVVLMCNVPRGPWLSVEAKSICSSLNIDVVLDNLTCTLSTSMGIALFPDAGETFESLYKKADTALYLTKEKGRNGFTIYEYHNADYAEPPNQTPLTQEDLVRLVAAPRTTKDN